MQILFHECRFSCWAVVCMASFCSCLFMVDVSIISLIFEDVFFFFSRIHCYSYVFVSAANWEWCGTAVLMGSSQNMSVCLFCLYLLVKQAKYWMYCLCSVRASLMITMPGISRENVLIRISWWVEKESLYCWPWICFIYVSWLHVSCFSLILGSSV